MSIRRAGRICHIGIGIGQRLDGTLGGDAEYLVYNWRSGTASPAATIDIELAHRDWALFVCCPIEDRGGRRRALIGDPTKYVTMADKRVAYNGDTAAGLAADGEPHVSLRWWIEGEGTLYRQPMANRPQDPWSPSAAVESLARASCW